MSIKGRMPWDAPAASSAYQSSDSINNTSAFIAMVEAIVSDTSDATDEEKCDALKGLLDATDKIAKEQEAGNDDIDMATERTSLLGELSAAAKDDHGSSASMTGFCTIS
jgi:ferritin-like metal-binding protein YciE